MNRKSSTGHSLALLTVLIWGTTFISTKVLLGDFQPLEILLYRFIIGFLALIIIRPKVLKGTNKKTRTIFHTCRFMWHYNLFFT